MDLTLAEHLGSLTSCAKGGVDIYKVNCDLSPILDTIKCRWLRVNNILSLGSEETQALVQVFAGQEPCGTPPPRGVPGSKPKVSVDNCQSQIQPHPQNYHPLCLLFCAASINSCHIMIGLTYFFSCWARSASWSLIPHLFQRGTCVGIFWSSSLAFHDFAFGSLNLLKVSYVVTCCFIS